jgi:hypothetical protein
MICSTPVMSVGSQLRASRHTCKRCRFRSRCFAFGGRNACILSFDSVQTGIKPIKLISASYHTYYTQNLVCFLVSAFDRDLSGESPPRSLLAPTTAAAGQACRRAGQLYRGAAAAGELLTWGLLVSSSPASQTLPSTLAAPSAAPAAPPAPPALPEPACFPFSTESACTKHLASTASQARTGGGDLLLAESTEAGAPPLTASGAGGCDRP